MLPNIQCPVTALRPVQTWELVVNCSNWAAILVECSLMVQTVIPLRSEFSKSRMPLLVFFQLLDMAAPSVVGLRWFVLLIDVRCRCSVAGQSLLAG
jgi:hypothetical protein